MLSGNRVGEIICHQFFTGFLFGNHVGYLYGLICQWVNNLSIPGNNLLKICSVDSDVKSFRYCRHWKICHIGSNGCTTGDHTGYITERIIVVNRTVDFNFIDSDIDPVDRSCIGRKNGNFHVRSTDRRCQFNDFFLLCFFLFPVNFGISIVAVGNFNFIT